MPGNARLSENDKENVPFLRSIIGTVDIFARDIHKFLRSSFGIGLLTDPVDGDPAYADLLSGLPETYTNKPSAMSARK